MHGIVGPLSMTAMIDTTFPSFRCVPAGRALAWWGEGWRSFLRAPVAWISLAFAWLVVMIVLRVLPFGGVLSNWLGLPLLTLGAVFAALLRGRERSGDAIEVSTGGAPGRGEDGALGNATARWKSRFWPLAQVSVLVLLLTFACVLLFLLAFGALFGFGMSGMRAWESMSGFGVAAGMGMAAGGAFMLVLAGLCALFGLNVAFWFVGTLVAIGGVRPWDAIRLSVRAGFANLGALVVFTLLLVPIGLVAMVPMGLGLLVLLPVLSGASYASYEDVFGSGGRVG